LKLTSAGVTVFLQVQSVQMWAKAPINCVKILLIMLDYVWML